MSESAGLKVILAQPSGFCAGVTRAIEAVEMALRIWGRPVYVFHPIVHNEHVTEALKIQGAIFIDDIEMAPCGSRLVFSAHGVSNALRQAARARNLRVVDATCPLVASVHRAARRLDASGHHIVLIGHRNHDEVQGTLGQIATPMSVISSPAEASSITIRNPERLAFLTQTTLSTSDVRQTVIALRKRFPNIVGPDEGDICYATENRQQAVRRLCQIVDLLLVVGSTSSSNSNRLCEVALAAGTPAHLLLDGSGLEAAWVDGKRCIGITAGASTPAQSVRDLLDALRRIAELEVSVMTGKQERVIFKPPPGLDLPHNC